jgi:hypothetical protein
VPSGTIARTPLAIKFISGPLSMFLRMVANAGSIFALRKRQSPHTIQHDGSYANHTEQSSNPARGLWKPFMRLAKDDSLHLYYSRENSPRDQVNIQRISHDGGETWGEANMVSGQGILARDGMIGLAEVACQLVAVFETDEDGIMHIKTISSRGEFQIPYLEVREMAS